MDRKFIMYIAYKTTQNLPGSGRINFNHFGKAKVFITMAIALNIFEIVLTVNALFFQKRLSLNGEALLSFYLFSIVIYFFVSLIFKKSTLAKAIKIYKESNFVVDGKSIGVLYIFLNIIIVVFLIYKM